MIRAEVRVLITATVVAASLGVAGFAFAGSFHKTEVHTTDGKGGELKPLVVKAGSVRSLFDSDDGLYPGHSADITMVVSNPNQISMNITSISPAGNDAKTVKSGTTPDDTATRAYCTDRLTLAATPEFTVDARAATRRISAAAEVTIVLHAAVSLNPDTENSCQGMQFDTKWTVASQNG